MSRLCSSAADCNAALGLSGPAGGKYCPPHVAPAARRAFVRVSTSCSTPEVASLRGVESTEGLHLGVGGTGRGGAGARGAFGGTDDRTPFVDTWTVNTWPSGAVQCRTSGSALDGRAVQTMQRRPAAAVTLRKGANMPLGKCSARATPKERRG